LGRPVNLLTRNDDQIFFNCTKNHRYPLNTKNRQYPLNTKNRRYPLNSPDVLQGRCGHCVAELVTFSLRVALECSRILDWHEFSFLIRNRTAVTVQTARCFCYRFPKHGDFVAYKSYKCRHVPDRYRAGGNNDRDTTEQGCDTVSSSHRCGICRNSTQATERVLWEVGITSLTTSNCAPAVLSQVSQPRARVASEGCEQKGVG
jgi:hypothetical protein